MSKKYSIGSGNSEVDTTIQPKLGYRFKVVFVGMGEASSTSAITGYVTSFTPASFSQEPVVVDAYVSRYYVIGKHTIGTISVELRNDMNNVVSSLIQKQVDRQYNAAQQSHAASAGAVKFITKLMYLDGTNGFADTPKVLEAYIYTGCWITETSASAMNYAESGVSTISLTIQPDNVFHVVDGLSNDESVNIGNASTNTITAATTGTSAT